jgi:hypothetical protein
VETETSTYVTRRGTFDHHSLSLDSIANEDDLLDLVADDELRSDNVVIKLKDSKDGIERRIGLLTTCVDSTAISNVDWGLLLEPESAHQIGELRLI